MTIDVYEGVDRKEITAERRTSEGKPYSLNHPDELVVNMRYKGEGKSGTNSQGWERNSSYYFKEVQKSHPEAFSKKNTMRIENGESPRVDKKFVESFPQYKGYENETLIHHHVGKDGQAVAVPQSTHKGSGEIHLYENELGITDNGQAFSDRCKAACKKNPEMVGKTSDEFKAAERAQIAKNSGSRQNAVHRQTDNAISRAATSKDSGHIEAHSNSNAITAASTKSSNGYTSSVGQGHGSKGQSSGAGSSGQSQSSGGQSRSSGK